VIICITGKAKSREKQAVLCELLVVRLHHIVLYEVLSQRVLAVHPPEQAGNKLQSCYELILMMIFTSRLVFKYVEKVLLEILDSRKS